MESMRGQPPCGCLINFEIRARGEPPHLVAAYRGLHLQNSGLPFSEFCWKARNSPNGQVPILKLPDGRFVAETIDICKHLAQLPSPLGDASCPLLCDEAQCSIFRSANTAPIIWDRMAGPGAISQRTVRG